MADKSKTSAVADWPAPKIVKELQKFLGLANYYYIFIEKFATIVAPLTEILQKQVAWKWGSTWKSVFDEFKETLVNPPVFQLSYFDFALETDASKISIGSLSMQDTGNGLQPVQYYSKKLTSAETRYFTHDRELQETVQSFKRFRPYVANGHTTVLSDYEPLKFIRSQPNLNDRQIRWMQHMAQYNYTVKCKLGAQNTAVYALSRRPDYNKASKKLVSFADQLGLSLCTMNYFDNTQKAAFIEVVEYQLKNSESSSMEFSTHSAEGTLE